MRDGARVKRVVLNDGRDAQGRAGAVLMGFVLMGSGFGLLNLSNIQQPKALLCM